MFLSIVTFAIIGPLMVISGFVLLVKEIIKFFSEDDIEQTNENQEYNIRHETPEEEEQRVEEYGLDDEWGKLK